MTSTENNANAAGSNKNKLFLIIAIIGMIEYVISGLAYIWLELDSFFPSTPEGWDSLGFTYSLIATSKIIGGLLFMIGTLALIYNNCIQKN